MKAITNLLDAAVCAGSIILMLLRDGMQVTVTEASHVMNMFRQQGIKENIQLLKINIQRLAVSAMERLTTALAPGLQYQHPLLQIIVVLIVLSVPRVVQPAAP